jgi:hypothetical protein
MEVRHGNLMIADVLEYIEQDHNVDAGSTAQRRTG